MTRLIGIGGKLASGKDTVADYLVAEHGWVKFGMSDALGDALYELNPIIDTKINRDGESDRIVPAYYRPLVDRVGYVEAKTNPEVRRLLQVLGTEVGRKMIDENVWVDIILRRIASAQVEGYNVIVTGIRFQNEIAMIRRIGGEGWWVDRPGLDTPEGAASHSSENGVSLTDFDLLLSNSGTLTQLYAQVDRELQE